MIQVEINDLQKEIDEENTVSDFEDISDQYLPENKRDKRQNSNVEQQAYRLFGLNLLPAFLKPQARRRRKPQKPQSTSGNC